MKFTIITGVSGAGKTIALKTFEDMGYYCVDNLPVFLIDQFAELCKQNKERTSFAISIDTRSGKDLNDIPAILKNLDQKGIEYSILFLDAEDRVLIKRYKESRRAHPLAGTGRIEDGILLERAALIWLKSKADIVIDTSSLLTRELTARLRELMSDGNNDFQNMVISLTSFGFKYGIPQDSDLVFDVRFLPNPYYDDALREKNGLSDDVSNFCLENEICRSFFERFLPLIDYLIPNYINEGKNQLVISIGCTGGKHRSVSVTEALYQHLEKSGKYIVKSTHRDIGK